MRALNQSGGIDTLIPILNQHCKVQRHPSLNRSKFSGRQVAIRDAYIRPQCDARPQRRHARPIGKLDRRSWRASPRSDTYTINGRPVRSGRKLALRKK
jgi:hypothetical protein